MVEAIFPRFVAISIKLVDSGDIMVLVCHVISKDQRVE